MLLFRFNPDESGVVIAETNQNSQESFLGLHFPSIDVPPIARQGFLFNPVRLIADLNASPSTIIPHLNPLTNQPLDFNLSTLKAVSPCHIQYYKNMGVSASCVISLIHEENLWGLIVCQHFSPKYITPEIRNYCEFLAKFMSLKLLTKQEQEVNNYRLEIKEIYSQIQAKLKEFINISSINDSYFLKSDLPTKEINPIGDHAVAAKADRQEKSISNILEANENHLLELLEAQGAAIYFGEELVLIGKTPSFNQVKLFVNWFSQNYQQEVFYTSHLAKIYTPAKNFTDTASGLLMISICLNITSYYIIWFRPEIIDTVNWGGNPAVQYTKNEKGELILNPRNSFELWKETVKEKSAPWRSLEIQAARDLRDLLTLTALEISQNALESAAEKAKIANQSKTQFLAKMSHELRTPLNAILGFSQIMNKDKSLSSEQQEYLKIINRSGEHLLSLINDVLEMSKIEAGRMTFNENHFDLYQVIESIAEMLQLKASAKNLQLILECDANIPKYVITDENKLRQVLINLIENAIKFTNEGWVKLRVYLGTELTQVFFEISDTGAGIATEELDNLFDPFIQSESGRKSMQGSGLGLSISKQFINLLGGNITVKSNPSEGSIFTFDIKLKLADELKEQTKSPNKQVIGLEPGQKEYKILIAEDVEENRLLLIRLLSPIGFKVRTVNNGAEAIATWKQWKPDLIWMDMLMPVMDGYEATRKIRQLPEGKNTKIIAITANAFSDAKIAPIEAGCDDYMAKPYREELLLEKMAQHLGVKYCYREDTESFANSTDEKFVLTAQSFKIMPQTWIDELHQASLSMDEDLIIDLIKQIPATEKNLVKNLNSLVENFRLDLLAHLTTKNE